jgi:hypothetical protein
MQSTIGEEEAKIIHKRPEKIVGNARVLKMIENDSNIIEVGQLWTQIEIMESQRRFHGLAYPEGQGAFPFRLTGQGFFPGGDGLWREDNELSVESSKRIRREGVMFLGNDFGTLRSYESLRLKSFENPVTWKNLKSRVRRANLPTDRAFFTNSVLGLRLGSETKALDKRDWQNSRQFAAFCREFLLFQVEALVPRLIVVLGPSALVSLKAFGLSLSEEGNSWVKLGSHETLLHRTTHPYGDFNFSPSRKEQDAAALHLAWAQATPNEPTSR